MQGQSEHNSQRPVNRRHNGFGDITSGGSGIRIQRPFEEDNPKQSAINPANEQQPKARVAYWHRRRSEMKSHRATMQVAPRAVKQRVVRAHFIVGHKNLALRTVIVLVTLGTIVVALLIIDRHLKWKSTSDNSVAAQTITSSLPVFNSPTLVTDLPNYTTILPEGKTINELGGWKRVSPTGDDPVYSFADKIGTIAVSVSEQPLPKNLQTNTPEAIAQLAQSSNAAYGKFSIGVTEVYIGASVNGQESLIFTKSNLLILITSDQIIDNSKWLAYISSFQ